MTEAICPNDDDRRDEEHSQLLSRLAASCHAQGSYHLACKKYTQAGDRVMAMKVMSPCAFSPRQTLFIM